MLHWLALLAIVLCASAIGGATVSVLRIPQLTEWERQSLGIAAGLGVLGVLLGLMALGGLVAWAPWAIGAAASVGLITRSRDAVRLVGRAVRPRLPSSINSWLLLLLLAAAALGATAPVTEGDSLVYPVPIVQHLVRDGQWRFWPNLAQSVYPLTQELLGAGMVALGSNRIGLLSAAELAVAALLIVSLTRRVTGRHEAGPVAAILTLGCPAVGFLAGAAKEDLLLLMQTTAAALALTLPPGAGAAVAAGLFAGLAAGAKYTGIPIALAVVACVPFTCGRDRPGPRVAASVSAAVAAGGLWYGVNLVRFGNPVPPLMPTIGWFPVTGETAEMWLQGAGYGRTAVDFLLAPWRMMIDVVSFREGEFGGRGNWINPAVWLGIPVLLLGRRRWTSHWWIFVISLALYVTWFNGMQVSRLLLPAAALLAVPAAGGLMALTGRMPLGRHLLTAGLIVSAGAVMAIGVVRAVRYAAQPSTFLHRETEHFASIQWMNEHLDPARDRVATEFRSSGHLAIRWMSLGPQDQVELQPADFATPEALRAALKRQGFTHVFASSRFDLVMPWLVPVFSDASSRIGGSRFFSTPGTESVAVFALQ